MLFSERDACWKLADFGSASQATSKRLNTTQFSRGTESYRAPEVLKYGRFNNRTDIFAVGCIIFEMLTEQKFFSSDWEVLQYSQPDNSSFKFEDRWPPTRPNTRFDWLRSVTAMLLTTDPRSRPGAKQTKGYLKNIRSGDAPFINPGVLEDEFFVEPPMPSNSAVTDAQAIRTPFRRSSERLSSKHIIARVFLSPDRAVKPLSTSIFQHRTDVVAVRGHIIPPRNKGCRILRDDR